MGDEFTPSTEQVRSHYVFDQSDRWDAERGEAFDRWLAGEKAAALREYAGNWSSSPEDDDEFYIRGHVLTEARRIEKKHLMSDFDCRANPTTEHEVRKQQHRDRRENGAG